jgi:hypothetical protein
MDRMPLGLDELVERWTVLADDQTRANVFTMAAFLRDPGFSLPWDTPAGR